MAKAASEDAVQILSVAGAPTSDVSRILAALPEWFGRADAAAGYARRAAALQSALARAEGRTVGFLSLERVSDAAVDIHVTAVEPAWRGRGVGRRLVEAAEGLAARRGARLLMVETVGASTPSAAYAETRAFYAAAGFLPLKEEPDGFGGGVSRLTLVKPVGAGAFAGGAARWA